MSRTGQHSYTATLQLEAYRIAMFQAHAALVLGTYLEPWSQALPELAARPELRVRLDRGMQALIVDDRPTPLLRMTVLNTLLMGRLHWRLTLVTAPAVLESSRALFAGLEDWVQVVGLRVQGCERFDWHTYNTLLKSPSFWDLLDVPRLLIVQTDTLLIEPPDQAAFAYGYVGAPWAKGRFRSEVFPCYGPQFERLSPRWETRRFCDTVPEGLSNGNGGLSIRDRLLMRRICEAEAAGSPPEEPEDIFFARHLARYDSRPAPLGVAEKFSCETAYERSAGAHAAWRYLPASEVAELFERHLKQVMALTAATSMLS
ncbi:hypothetical protein KBY93_04540 [Synechococcus sp. J7-Johnson]|uniref:DUF5672 family protein n=1 Tax=Synechococcus sp. J7-Johnson TaxID=2823737 RepID=UPI0020CFE304|nr:DUF5672 family protein [Synechococcus sp. J7-Johnson]MCP9839903.1 hypothetical protein [Synechococcus sp. J7-Johnson]